MSSQIHGNQPAGEPEDLDLDPHHEVHTHHVIIPVRVLTTVLLVLLGFTVLTVFCSRAEIWATNTFDVHIPQLVNVLIALSIAVVKSTLVAMYFMQLKYDNPLHALVFGFCLFALGLFLFFSLTDLGTRGVVFQYKQDANVVGGTGDSRVGAKPSYLRAREREIERVGAEKYRADAEAAHHAHAADHHAPVKPPSSANRSRPLRGPAGAKPGEHAPEGEHPPEGGQIPEAGHAPAPKGGH